MYTVHTNKYSHEGSAVTREVSQHHFLGAAVDVAKRILPYQRFAFVTNESGLQVYDATRHVLSAKAKRMLKKYGADRCVEGYHMHHIRGEGGSTVSRSSSSRRNLACVQSPPGTL